MNASVGILATFLDLAQGRVASAAQSRLDARLMALSVIFYSIPGLFLVCSFGANLRLLDVAK